MLVHTLTTVLAIRRVKRRPGWLGLEEKVLEDKGRDAGKQVLRLHTQGDETFCEVGWEVRKESESLVSCRTFHRMDFLPNR